MVRACPSVSPTSPSNFRSARSSMIVAAEVGESSMNRSLHVVSIRVNTHCGDILATTCGVRTPGERLKWAREKAGFRSARAAALANEWPESTYRAHEHDGREGGRGIDEGHAKKYARRFRVPWLWIMFGDVAP